MTLQRLQEIDTELERVNSLHNHENPNAEDRFSIIAYANTLTNERDGIMRELARPSLACLCEAVVNNLN